MCIQILAYFAVEPAKFSKFVHKISDSFGNSKFGINAIRISGLVKLDNFPLNSLKNVDDLSKQGSFSNFIRG